MSARQILPAGVGLLLALAIAAPEVRGEERPAWSEPLAARPGWSVTPSPHDFDTLLARLADAVAAEGLIVVTQAGPTGAARTRGIDIPGNRVVGIFNNDFAVRVLRLSVAAMIEAPIRAYVTENPDGTAKLSYKLPSSVLAPYSDEGGAALAEIATELDRRFAAIALRATAAAE